MRQPTGMVGRLGWMVLGMGVIGAGAPASGRTVTHYVYGEDHGQPTNVWVEGSTEYQTNALSDTTYAYDTLGRPWKVRQRVVGGDDDNVNDHITLTTYTYTGSVYQTIEKGSGNEADDIEAGDAVTTNEYDRLGRLTQTTLTDGESATPLRESRYEYDASGNITRTRQLATEGTYLDTVTEYDALNRAVKVIDPEKHYVDNAYDSQGRIITHTSYQDGDGDGQGGTALAKEAWYYDHLSRLSKTARFASATADYGSDDPHTDAVVEYAYDADGRLTQQTTYQGEDATALQTTSGYDELGQPLYTFDPAGNQRWTSYDYSTGLVLSREEYDGSGAHNTARGYTYDNVGRVTAETVSGLSVPDRVTTFGYDGLDRRISVTDPAGVETAYRYDTLGRQVRVTENANSNGARVTDSVYDRLGRLTQLIAYDGEAPDEPDPDDPNAQTTTYSYDLAGHRTQIAYPDASEGNNIVTFSYDSAGRMTRKVDQRSLVTVYDNDSRGLWLSKTVNTNGVDDYAGYVYDGLGRMTVAQRGTTADHDAVSQSDFAYNALSQLTGETQTLFGGTAEEVTYEYDPAGNRTALDYPAAGIGLTYRYDELNRVSAIERDTQTLAEYEYDGWLLTGRFIKTAAADTRWIEHRWAYDGNRRVQDQINHAVAGSAETLLAASHFTYDSVGNRLSASGSGNAAAAETIAYDYDRLNRLVSAGYTAAGGSETFRYDLLGNRDGDGGGGVYGYADTRPGGVNVGYGENNPANEHTTVSSNGVTHDVLYDDAGNLVLDEDGLGYGYDAENRMTRVFKDADRDGSYDSPGDTLLVEYAYDALGRRIEKADHTAQPTLRTRFLYDGQNIIEEVSTNGALRRYFVNGPTYIDERVLVYNAASDQEHYYLLKELYSVAGLANTNGELVEAYSYDAYGKVHIQSVTANPPCDVDADGDVDEADFAVFQACYRGSGTPPPQECPTAAATAFDHDTDNDIDLTDLSAFLACYNGPTFEEPPLPCSGDYNTNGRIDQEDWEAFLDCSLSTNGACLAVFDFDTNGVVDLYDYGVMLALLDALGSPPAQGCVAATETSTLNPYFFTGRWLDFVPTRVQSPPKQVYDYRARSYDPDDGRFDQRDPLVTDQRFTNGYRDGMNVYEYVTNNPLALTDPSGLQFAGPESRWKLKEALDPNLRSEVHYRVAQCTSMLSRACTKYKCCATCNEQECRKDAQSICERYVNRFRAWARSGPRFHMCTEMQGVVASFNLSNRCFKAIRANNLKSTHAFVAIFHVCNASTTSDANFDPWRWFCLPFADRPLFPYDPKCIPGGPCLPTDVWPPPAATPLSGTTESGSSDSTGE